MAAKIDYSGKAQKVVDIDTDIDLKPFEPPKELLDAIDQMRREGYSEQEVEQELRAQRTGGDWQVGPGRVQGLGSYPAPPLPMSQETINRLHGENARQYNDADAVSWFTQGHAAQQAQFLQTDAGDEIDLLKDCHLANLLKTEKGHGFSAGDQIIDVLFIKRMLKKSRIDRGVPNERAWTVGQFSMSNQRFEETPERPKQNPGFFRTILGGGR